MPDVQHRTRVAVVAGLLPLLLVAAGCAGVTRGQGQLSDGAGPNSASTTSGVAEPGAGQCGVYERGSDLRIIVTGPNAECSALARDLSSGGMYWTLQPQAASEQLSMVCIMTEDGIVAEVDDSGDQIFGQTVCGSLLSSGWNEDQPAEQSASASAARAAASASAASASASAAAAASESAAEQQQQDQSDENAAAQDISNLTGTTSSIGGDLQSIADDLKTADQDLAQTRADAQQGAGENCSNMSTVDSDAANTVTSDVRNTLAADVNNTLTYDLNQTRQGIAAVNADNQRLAADGLAPADGSTAAVMAAQAEIKHAVATANIAIDHGNADVSAAYQVAADLAVGACSGEGPGSPPQPLGHIS